MSADFQSPVAAPSVGAFRTALAAVAGGLFAFTLAVLGGALGIVGAAIQELRTGGFLLLPFLGAPIIEEMMKPVGVSSSSPAGRISCGVVSTPRS